MSTMSADPRSPLPPADAYRLWSATYDEENPLSALDEVAVRILTPPLAGLALLDAACGTARRLAFQTRAAPRAAVGVDLVIEMLSRARSDQARSRRLAAGDLRALPVPAGSFDVVWCRLASGHVESLPALYRELARAGRSGGIVVVTDFHPAAVRGGHVRSFRAAGAAHLVEHAVHEPETHESAARSAGLTFDARLDLAIDSWVLRFYEAAGARAQFERDRGLPLLLAFRFRVGSAP